MLKSECENINESNQSNHPTSSLESISSFEELGLQKNLLRGIYAFGFNFPSEIQSLGILPILRKKDLIAQAQSGTGKTGTFVIGSLEIIDYSISDIQILVLSPTRELSDQIYKNFQCLGEFLQVKVLNLTGGTKVKENIAALKQGAHVVVATPGRILDLIEKKIINLAYLKCLILDEADELLKRGFLEEMKKVIAFIPPECKINLFSATMPKEILELTDQFMNDPYRILISNEEVNLNGIAQYYITLKKEWKQEILLQLYKGLDIAQAVIFCNSKKQCDSLCTLLRSKGHMVSCLHSELNSQERNKVMADFRNGATRVLVSTDLIARGIDVSNISIVINYDFPTDKETYIHRIGRSGRYGKKGTAINFILPEEKESLDSIIKLYDIKMDKLPEDLGKIK